jgi:phosphoglycolate phosphatase-like HAD superfamily hydrolase
MSGTPLLVLDFDGVVCDSMDECFVSSWIAYFTLYTKTQPPQVPTSLRRDFARLRPFIKTGEDYVLIQEILSNGTDAADQAGFDALIEQAGSEKMARFKEHFAAARNELLEKDRPFWLSLNRIYPHMLAAFTRLPKSAPIHILSTKDPRFIREILAASRIRLPEERISRSGTHDKLSRVDLLLRQERAEKAVFIDDQIEHLKGNVNPGIEVYLAGWGYVKPEWLTGGSGIAVLGPEDFISLIEKEFVMR